MILYLLHLCYFCARRSRGRPTAKWLDDIVGLAGTMWMRLAQDWLSWRVKEEAYTQQW